MNTAISANDRLWAYLQMMRPANIVTAWADILAGFAISGCMTLTTQESHLGSLMWLLLSTTGLYGGGIVFNDIFDSSLDAVERPERPLPSGRASLDRAILLATLLLSIGILAAAKISLLSSILACGVATAAILYDALGKHHKIFGPLNMGICRGGNLLLGVSVMPLMVVQYWFLALIPIVYIAAVTTLSRGEVKGGNHSNGIVALVMLTSVIAGLLGLGLLNHDRLLAMLPFIVLLAARVLVPFIKATREPIPTNIQMAVRAGVLSLIVLDATVAASFAGLLYGLLVLSLLPISTVLAKKFAVT